MLGWFKKKFGKKKKVEEPSQPEEVQQKSEVLEPEPVTSPEPEGKQGDELAEQQGETAIESSVEKQEVVEDVGEGELETSESYMAEPLVPESTLESESDISVVEKEVDVQDKIVADEAEEFVLEEPSEHEREQAIEASITEAPIVETESDQVVENVSEPILEEVEVVDVEPQVEAVDEIEIIDIKPDVYEDTVTEQIEEVEGIPSDDTESVEIVEDVQVEEVAAEVIEPLDDPDDALEDGLSEKAPRDVASVVEKPQSRSLFKRLRERLGKTRDSLVYRLDSLFLGRKEIDQDLFDELEEILITADLGVETTFDLLEHARTRVARDELSDPQSLKAIIQDRILSYIQSSDQPAELVMPDNGPFVIMVIGVNGVGKTTTIGKIASKFVKSGQSVLMIAGDTFRAAAIDQLKIWGERVGVEVVAQNPGADPSSVVFDGLEYGIAHEYDVLLIDTAGRLHTSVNLMEELKKIKRVIGKKMDGAPHEVMLVLDSTTGQNSLSQAKLFNEAVNITGLTMTKLDGTAKGGIVANICREMKIPVRFIGIGEQIDDLQDFNSREYVDALFANEAEE